MCSDLIAELLGDGRNHIPDHRRWGLQSTKKVDHCNIRVSMAFLSSYMQIAWV